MRWLGLGMAAAFCLGAAAQDVPPPAAPAQAEVVLQVDPLPGRFAALPFASPRDAARYRLQLALAAYKERHDLPGAIRGLLQAALLDPAYALAAFDLAVLLEERGQWDDAVSFVEEAVKIAEGPVSQAAKAEAARARAIAGMEKTPESRKRRKFDSALLAALRAAAAEKDWMKQLDLWEKLARQDDTRYEPFARSGALLADHAQLAEAAEAFGEAVKRSPADLRPRMDELLVSAKQDLTVHILLRSAARAVADGNADKAAQSFLKVWESDPDQPDAGLQGAGYLVAQGKTQEVVAVLARLCAFKGFEASRKAEAMLKALMPVEPAAGGGCASPSALPPRPAATPKGSYQERLPSMATPLMLAADAPPPTLIFDNEPVALLESFVQPGFTGAASPEMLDQTGMAQVTGEHAYEEYRRGVPPVTPTEEPAAQEVDIPGGRGTPRLVRLRTNPHGAAVTVNDADTAVCRTPCDLKIALAKLKVTFTLERYKPETASIPVSQAMTEYGTDLARRRGQLRVDTPEPAQTITINGKTLAQQVPGLFSLPLGVYRVSVPQSGGKKERLITVVADRQVQLKF